MAAGTRFSRGWLRFWAHFLAAWTLLVMPLQWSMPYWWPLRWSEVLAEAGDLTLFPSDEQHMMNQRTRNSVGRHAQHDTSPVRLPSAVEDNTPVRTPKTFVTAEDGEIAAGYAEKYVPLTVQETVQAAQPANDFAQSIYGTADLANYTYKTDPAVPGNQTGDTIDGKTAVNINELMPGYTENTQAELSAYGSTLYDDPEHFRAYAEKHDRELKRETCLSTSFALMRAQNEADAGNPLHHVLKVSFYRDVREEATEEGDPELERIAYPGGVVDIRVPTLGGSAGEWLESLGGDYYARYEYRPHTAPDGQDYFTYNHTVRYWVGGGWQDAPAHWLQSVGSPEDGWTPQGALNIPEGTMGIYLSADLYQAQHNEVQRPDGITCPANPPLGTCVVDGVEFCDGTPGASIVTMFDPRRNPSSTAIAKQFSDHSVSQYEPAITAEMSNEEIIDALLMHLTDGEHGLAEDLTGTCTRDVVNVVDISIEDAYEDPELAICSETLLNPYPAGCEYLEREFSLGATLRHPFLTVGGWETRFVTSQLVGYDPETGDPIYVDLYDKFQKNWNGKNVYSNTFWSPDEELAPFGESPCDPETKTCYYRFDPNHPNDNYVSYYHNPLPDPYEWAVVGYEADCGEVTYEAHYGYPEENWFPEVQITGNCEADGPVRVYVLVKPIIRNSIGGPCEDYLDFVADGFCDGGALTCVEYRNPATVGGVTFGPGMKTSGIIDLMAIWGREESSDFPDYDNGGTGVGPTLTGPQFELLPVESMCWKARGEPFGSCTTMTDHGGLEEIGRPIEGGLTDAIWLSDCAITEGPDGKNLITDCVADTDRDDCDSRFESLFMDDFCYNPSRAYDCGTTENVDIQVEWEEEGASCTGEMRCLGTECHRPNLTGDNLDDFAQAAAGMEALNMMKASMICKETGAPPTSADETCTPVVFGGDNMYCKIPIGNQIGLTPHCCNEAEEAAADGPDWIQYLQATFILWKISENQIIQNFLGQSQLYNSTAQMFGEIAEPITNVFKSASEFVTEKFVEPLAAGFDNMFSGFGSGGSASAQAASEVAVDATAKTGVIGQVKHKFAQMLLEHAHNILESISPGLGNQLIPLTPTGYIMNPMLKQIISGVQLAMMIYSFLKIIGHIVFACTQEEFEWAMKEKWRLCTYVGSCCNQKFLGVCLEKRRLYCCYDSIAGRVIAEQILLKGLIPNRGYEKDECDINCGGFTPDELAQVDWEQVDLTEWLDSLVDSGLHTPMDPATDYGVTEDSVSLTNTVARVEDYQDQIDERVPAYKTVEGLEENTDKMATGTAELAEEGHCYDDDDRKMPYVYPECWVDPGTIGYEPVGMTPPSSSGSGPAGGCPAGWSAVPQMSIPVDESGGTRTVAAFCVSTFMVGDQGDGTPVLGTASTRPLVSGVDWARAQEICGGLGGQLIRDSQWMALAHNIAIMGYNWTGGDFGAGKIKGGLNMSQCGEDGPFSLDECPNASADGRERVLTNGATVYDIGGNMMQLTYNDMAGADGAGRYDTVEFDQIAVPYPPREKGVGAYPDFTGAYFRGGVPARSQYWWVNSAAGPFSLDAVNPDEPVGAGGFGVRCTR